MKNMDIGNEKKLTRDEWDKQRLEFKESLSKDYELSDKQVHIIMKKTPSKSDWEADIESFKDEHYTDNGVEIEKKEVGKILGQLSEEYEDSMNFDNDPDMPGDEIKPTGWQLEEQVRGRIKHQEFEAVSSNASLYVANNAGNEKEAEKEIIKDLNKIIEERGLGGQPVVSNEVYKKHKELSEDGQTEIAKPGRTYSGNIVDVGEDVTIQKTKTGKFVIHETENLPGIQENDEKGFSKIRYDSGGKGDILQKSNDHEIGKQKELEKKQENELNY